MAALLALPLLLVGAAAAASSGPPPAVGLPDLCRAAVLWPVGVQISQPVNGTPYTVCVLAPTLPAGIVALIAPNIGPFGVVVSNDGGNGLAYDVQYGLAPGGPSCSGTLAVNSTPSAPCAAPLVPGTVPDPGYGNYSVGGFVTLSAVTRTTQFIMRLGQQCVAGPETLDRRLCVYSPPGALDFYIDASQRFLGPAYVAVGGCSVQPSECGDVAGQPCCLPGWTQVAPTSGATSCGANCFNCTGLCAPPSATATSSSSPTPSSTGSTSATVTPSRSHSGAGATAALSATTAFALVAAAALLSATHSGGAVKK